jgi:hypothetical protein
MPQPCQLTTVSFHALDSIDSLPSGLNVMNRIQSVERRNGQLARLWHQNSGMCVVLYSSINSEKVQTSNSEYLNDEIKKNRPHLKKKKVLFHQDNAPCHKSIKKKAKLQELSYELLAHPPFSRDLAHSDFFCLQTSKKWKEI